MLLIYVTSALLHKLITSLYKPNSIPLRGSSKLCRQILDNELIILMISSTPSYLLFLYNFELV